MFTAWTWKTAGGEGEYSTIPLLQIPSVVYTLRSGRHYCDGLQSELSMAAPCSNVCSGFLFCRRWPIWMRLFDKAPKHPTVRRNIPPQPQARPPHAGRQPQPAQRRPSAPQQFRPAHDPLGTLTGLDNENFVLVQPPSPVAPKNVALSRTGVYLKSYDSISSQNVDNKAILQCTSCYRFTNDSRYSTTAYCSCTNTTASRCARRCI